MENGQVMFGGKITRVLSQMGLSQENLDCLVLILSNIEKKHAKEVRYIGNYEIESTLAEGLYGQVRLARHHLTKERVSSCADALRRNNRLIGLH